MRSPAVSASAGLTAAEAQRHWALNFRDQTRTAIAIVKVGPGGDVVLRASLVFGSAHVLLDVTGYFGP